MGRNGGKGSLVTDQDRGVPVSQGGLLVSFTWSVRVGGGGGVTLHV